MPMLLNAASVVCCPHGAPCNHAPGQQRVLLSGTPALTALDVNAIVGCAFTLPSGTPSPCVTVQWVGPSTRVKLMGQPALVQTSAGLCKAATQAPQGTPIVSAVQPRVQGL